MPRFSPATPRRHHSGRSPWRPHARAKRQAAASTKASLNLAPWEGSDSTGEIGSGLPAAAPFSLRTWWSFPGRLCDAGKQRRHTRMGGKARRMGGKARVVEVRLQISGVMGGGFVVRGASGRART